MNPALIILSDAIELAIEKADRSLSPGSGYATPTEGTVFGGALRRKTTPRGRNRHSFARQTPKLNLANSLYIGELL